MNYYLNIGSNMGNRTRNIARAIRLISRTFNTNIKISAPVTSSPWGFESKNVFVNEGAILHTDVKPTEVLARLQQVERLISDKPHRNADGSYSDRVIDIDIVAIDDMTIDTPSLKVPHPHLPERDFYLIPMRELAPSWVHPQSRMTPGEMLDRLQSQS